MTQPTEYATFGAPITPDTIGDLIAFHRATFGGYRMEGETTSTDTGTATTDSGGTSTGATTTTTSDSTSTGATAEEKKLDLTQAGLDRIIAERLAKERKMFEQQLAEVQATAGKTELEAAQIKAQQAEERVGSVTKESAQRVAGAEAKLAAHLAGAKKDRLEAVLKQADLTDAVAADGTVDSAKVQTAIDKVLADYPEWKGTTITTPGGELKQGETGKRVWSRSEIAALSAADRKAHLADINAAAAEGRIKD